LEDEKSVFIWRVCCGKFIRGGLVNASGAHGRKPILASCGRSADGAYQKVDASSRLGFAPVKEKKKKTEPAGVATAVDGVRAAAGPT
jgi:hypothetical protein